MNMLLGYIVIRLLDPIVWIFTYIFTKFGNTKQIILISAILTYIIVELILISTQQFRTFELKPSLFFANILISTIVYYVVHGRKKQIIKLL